MILRLVNLKNLRPGEFFKSGNFIEHGQVFRWVAVAGAVNDWAIYFDHEGHTYRFIHEWGKKLYDVDKIKKLVPCTDEALKNYRM